MALVFDQIGIQKTRSDFRALIQQSLPCLPWVYTSNRPDAFAFMEAKHPGRPDRLCSVIEQLRKTELAMCDGAHDAPIRVGLNGTLFQFTILKE